MNKSIFLYVLMLTVSYGIAQVPADAIQAIKNIGSFSQFGHYTELVVGSKVAGSPYLDEHWKVADITLASGQTLHNYSIRYNLAGDFLEIKMLEGVKAIERKSIMRLSIDDTLQARQFVVDTNEDSGLFEILVKGNLQLLCKHEVTVKPPDYVAQFNVGSRDTHILHKETLFYKQDSLFSKLPGRPNTFFKIFGSRENVVRTYVDQHDLSIRKRTDVIMTFQYYNTLVSP